MRPQATVPGIAAEIEIGPVDPLHRKAERLVADIVVDIDAFRDRRSSGGPRYHGVLPDGAMTLSPKRAEIGIGTIEVKPSCAANAT